ncbi:MAG TPA: metallophosphoesterase [Verrucomicrobiae bacterium]
MPQTDPAQNEGRKLTRRRWIIGTLLAAPILGALNALWWEPTWLKVSRPKLSLPNARTRIVHLTDLHHKGDRAWLEKVVKAVNTQEPKIVCFTGDLVEESSHLAETLEILSGIKAPIFGVPGNHDDWSGINFTEVKKSFQKNGGDWLEDGSVTLENGRLAIVGSTIKKAMPVMPTAERRIALFHYPQWVEKLGGQKYDLMLAGHSHGGQVRIPGYGPLIVPFQVGRYDLGLFQTAAGPLYVSSGIGWFMWKLRFNCRPEIAVFEV